jgi:HSP20 family protein
MVAMRRPSRRSLPELFDWADGLPEAFTWAIRPYSTRLGGIRVEDLEEGDRYVVRAELPGLDPDDIAVEVAAGELVIRAERRQERRGRRSSEFRYGSMTRRVALPAGADESGITARYDAGIVEITVPLQEKRAEPRAIPVQRSGPAEGDPHRGTRGDDWGARGT